MAVDALSARGPFTRSVLRRQLVGRPRMSIFVIERTGGTIENQSGWDLDRLFALILDFRSSRFTLGMSDAAEHAALRPRTAG